MFFLVQLPFADLRPFLPNANNRNPIRTRPDWTVPPDSRNPEFLRGVGGLRKRTSFRKNDQVIWPGEGWYATARRGIRFPLITANLFSDPRISAAPHTVVRRIYSNGAESWRVDIGVGFWANDVLSLKEAIALSRELLNIPVRVRSGERRGQRKGTFGPPGPLVEQRDRIGELLMRATGVNAVPIRSKEHRGFVSGRPLLIIESTNADEPFEIEITDAELSHVRGFSHGVPETVECCGLVMRFAQQEIPTVVLRTRLAPDAPEVWGHRVALGRVHAEREILTEVLRSLGRGQLPESPILERYIARVHRDFFAQSRFGVAQSGVHRAIATYEALTPAETLALEDKLTNRRQSQARVDELIKGLAPLSGPILIAEEGSTITMSSNYVAGNVVGSQLNAGTTFQNASVAIGLAPTGDVPDKLAQLLELTKSLADRLQDDAAKQRVANKMETLAKEATAIKPDRSMLEVTGKGLVEAAKTVAEMAAPVATAVGVVLGLFGVVL